MASNKELGNEQFKAKNYDKAIEFYTQAIAADPGDHTIYGNRSASYHNLKKFDEALQDGEQCIALKADWSKGYQRKGMALHGMQKFEEAKDAYQKGLDADPANAQLRSQMQALF